MPYRFRTLDPTRQATPRVQLLTADEVRDVAPLGDQILAIFERDSTLKEISLCFDDFVAVEITRVSSMNGAPRYVTNGSPSSVA